MRSWYSLDWLLPTQLGQFSWINPYSFLFFLIIPSLILLQWIFRTKKRETLPLHFEEGVEVGRFVSFRHLISSFFTLGLITLIIAAARPQLPQKGGFSSQGGISIALAIDISESMEAVDLRPSRLQAAKQFAENFIKSRRHEDRIALVAFAGETKSISPLSNDHMALIRSLKVLDSKKIRASGTAIGLAVASAINKLREIGSKSKVIVLISDGDNTAGAINPTMASQMAQNFGVRVYSILVGKDATTENLDEGTLKNIAHMTKGKFFKALDNRSLDKVIRDINTLEKSNFEADSSQNMVDYYYIYLYWTLFFFIIGFVLKFFFFGNLLED